VDARVSGWMGRGRKGGEGEGAGGVRSTVRYQPIEKAYRKPSAPSLPANLPLQTSGHHLLPKPSIPDLAMFHKGEI